MPVVFYCRVVQLNYIAGHKKLFTDRAGQSIIEDVAILAT